jgi:hypothetical protein
VPERAQYKNTYPVLKRMPNPKVSSHASIHRVHTTPHRQSD